MSTNAIATVKNSFLNLSDIYGVDLDAGTVTHHPSLFQPKEELREDVIESILTAAGPDAVAPIEIMLLNDGTIGVVDGYHRLTAFARYSAANPKSDKFRKIRVVRNYGSEDEAEFAAVRANFEGGRSNLTPAEEVNAIERFLRKGYNPAEINDKLGGANQRHVKKITDILERGIPELKEAVAKGRISTETATKVARKVAPAEQSAAIAKAEKAEKATKGGKAGTTSAAVAAGLRQGKMSVMKVGEIVDYGLTFIPDVLDAQGKEEEVDPVYIGQMNAVNTILKLDGLSKTANSEKWRELQKEAEEKLAKKAAKAEKPVKAPKVVAPKAEKTAKPKAEKPTTTKPAAAGNKSKVNKGDVIVVEEKTKPTGARPKINLTGKS